MNKPHKPMSENARKLIAYEQEIQEETRRFVANTLIEYRETFVYNRASNSITRKEIQLASQKNKSQQLDVRAKESHRRIHYALEGRYNQPATVRREDR